MKQREKLIYLIEEKIIQNKPRMLGINELSINIADYLITHGIVETIHGKWIKISESCGIDVLECSVCHGVHPRYATSFCCDCGAKMDGSDTE